MINNTNKVQNKVGYLIFCLSAIRVLTVREQNRLHKSTSSRNIMKDGVTLADRFTSVTVIFLLGFRFGLKVVSFDIFIEIEINFRDFFYRCFVLRW